MPDKEAVLGAAMDDLRETAKRVGATQVRIWSSKLSDRPDCCELLSPRHSMVSDSVEAAYVEAH